MGRHVRNHSRAWRRVRRCPADLRSLHDCGHLGSHRLDWERLLVTYVHRGVRRGERYPSFAGPRSGSIRAGISRGRPTPSVAGSSVRRLGARTCGGRTGRRVPDDGQAGCRWLPSRHRDCSRSRDCVGGPRSPAGIAAGAVDLAELSTEEIIKPRVTGLGRGLHLLPRALLGILVRAEAQKTRAVAEPLLLHLVEPHFADDLRTDLVPRKVFPLRPARSALGRAAPFLFDVLILFEEWREHLLLLRLQRTRDA